MKLGIGIISWNRPEYLKQSIESLENNNLKDCHFHLFQDGHTCKFTGNQVADPEKINESINVFLKSKLPNKNYNIRNENVSVAINQFEAMQVLCQKYKYFIFLENDVVVSLNFIEVMKKLLKQFEKDKKIACISPGFKLLCKKENIEKNLDKLIFKRGHFWTEACWSEKWRIIEKFYMPYYNIVKEKPYHKRDEIKIKRLFKDNGVKMLTTSQDQGKDWAIGQSGMRRIKLIVNRATGIGDKGIHSTAAKLKQTGDGHNPIYAYKEELDIKKFKLC